MEGGRDWLLPRSLHSAARSVALPAWMLPPSQRCLSFSHAPLHPPLTHPPAPCQAADLEMRCLKNLRWRLGPYCCAPSTPARV